jgi:hypothetical protein
MPRATRTAEYTGGHRAGDAADENCGRRTRHEAPTALGATS